MLETAIQASASALPVQNEIIAAMEAYKERWESIFLFSSEGFLLAQQGTSGEYGEENLLEFSCSLIESAKLVENKLSVEEITVRGLNGRMLVFFCFNAWNEKMVLAVVASFRSRYRRALRRLVKHICSLG